MVPEEDCPLQECQRAELPHQVGNSVAMCFDPISYFGDFSLMIKKKNVSSFQHY